ncbi:isochorismatase family protein [Nocardioides mangrovicus]|uniref:Isochorismatase family protein n=1 Tax=Nocardioides mangrovicus TaxID=2478913 RepID=A0A3L8P505_9ACTN|nr:isochorismatase family protein [Nocardioides mangrovicus]RLV50214.1 isochorismatase family protein [Nocardioides mangrovicus]
MTISALDPHAALVVVDLQRGVLGVPTEPQTADEVLARSVRLAEAFRAAGQLVVLVRVSFAPDGADAMPGRTERAVLGRTLPGRWDELSDELTGHPEDVVVTKRNWGAFHGTGLDVQLRRRGVTQVFLTGIATTAGVESTARAAHEHGYHVVVVTDAVADRSADHHRHSVEHVFPRLGETGTTDDVLALLG